MRGKRRGPGYWFNRSPLPWLKRLSLQLNVNNVFNEDDACILRCVIGTNPETSGASASASRARGG